MVGEYLQKFRLPVGLALVGLVLIVGGVFASGIDKSKPKEYPKESMVQSQKLITVDVSGAVKNPGVYKLQDGARIEDAIAMAGGFKDDSNKEYISKYLNMAQMISDGSKLYIPFAGEQAIVPQTGAVAGAQTSGNVNINTATQAELEALPSIGPVTASKIISDRPYQKTEDLLNKKVVSKAVFEKIKGQLVVY